MISVSFSTTRCIMMHMLLAVVLCLVVPYWSHCLSHIIIIHTWIIWIQFLLISYVLLWYIVVFSIILAKLLFTFPMVIFILGIILKLRMSNTKIKNQANKISNYMSTLLGKARNLYQRASKNSSHCYSLIFSNCQ